MSCPSNCYKAALGQCLDEASAADSTKATNAHVFQVVTSFVATFLSCITPTMPLVLHCQCTARHEVRTKHSELGLFKATRSRLPLVYLRFLAFRFVMSA